MSVTKIWLSDNGLKTTASVSYLKRCKTALKDYIETSIRHGDFDLAKAIVFKKLFSSSKAKLLAYSADFVADMYLEEFPGDELVKDLVLAMHSASLLSRESRREKLDLLSMKLLAYEDKRIDVLYSAAYAIADPQLNCEDLLAGLNNCFDIVCNDDKMQILERGVEIIKTEQGRTKDV